MTFNAVYSTIDARDVARLAEAAYDIGPIVSGWLINRGINDIYELRSEEGRRHIARLSGRRYRGPANLAYETGLLQHLKQRGAPVAAPLADRSGALWRTAEAAEGPREFALFEHVDGHTPLRTMIQTGTLNDATRDCLGLLGAALAQVHSAGANYVGPESRYEASAQHMLAGPLAQILAAPAIDNAAREGFLAVVDTLTARFGAIAAGLSRVHCHGDAHFGNALMRGANAVCPATWFDFDDAAPGNPAYDLATFLWAMLRHTRSAELNPTSEAMWRSFLAGYRSARPLAAADHQAIGFFVAVRQVWFAGEYASKSEQWGTQTISADWLNGELASLRMWQDLVTPDA